MLNLISSLALRVKPIFATLVLLGGLSFTLHAQAQQCAVPGRDGIASVTTAPNTYYSGATAAITAGSTSLTLGTLNAAGASTAFTAGDLLLIIQMQDSTGTLEGNFEYARVASVAGSTVTLAAGLTNAYAQSISTTSLQTYQIIRVPQYSSATVGNVTVPPWTLTDAGVGSGGVFVMDVAGTLTVNGTINANGAGFRGAYGVNGGGNAPAGTVFNTANYTPTLTAMNGGLKGEGTNGVPNRVFTGVLAATTYTNGLYATGTAGQGASGNAGGGGNDGAPLTSGNGENSGGGGGGNAGTGGAGGNSWADNNAAGGRGGLGLAPSVTKLYLGGGGGAGSANNASTTSTLTAYPPTTPTAPNAGNGANPNGATGEITLSGGKGGGIVILHAGSVAYTSGGIQANGIAAYTSSSSSDGGGGGGAGGSVIVQAASSTGNLPISAVGGRGGDAGFYDHGPGGGGGGGFVGVSAGVSTTNTVTGGANGLDANNGGNTTPDAYGATAGTGGVSNAALATPPTGAATPNACLPALTVTKTTSTPAREQGIDGTATYTVLIANATGKGDATGVNIFDDLPSPFTYLSTPAPTVAYASGATGPASPITAITTGTDPVTFGTAAGTAA